MQTELQFKEYFSSFRTQAAYCLVNTTIVINDKLSTIQTD